MAAGGGKSEGLRKAESAQGFRVLDFGFLSLGFGVVMV